MIGYINEVVLRYVNSQRSSFEEEKPALIIMDNLKGQITYAVEALLEETNIFQTLPTGSSHWMCL